MKNRKAPQAAWGRGAALAFLLACALLSASCKDPARPETTDSPPPAMVYVAGGTFTMGSPEDETDRNSDETQHTVTVGGFYMGKYPVIQGQYWAATGDSPSNFTDSDNLPVEKVTWYDAVEFCNKLSKAEGLKPAYTVDKTSKDPNNNSDRDNNKWTVTWNQNANGYRLPTEAEWEYAARGGSNPPQYYTYAGSNTADNVAWYEDNSGDRTHEVGGKAANSLGLYDMSGNVFEWCWDWHGNYPTAAETNPTGASSGSSRVIRGGSWFYDAALVRSAFRIGDTPSIRFSALGFRLVRP